MSFDAIVIGAGHNGLVAATFLARSGMRVLVTERRSVIGGLCAMDELHPGYRVPGILHDTFCLRPAVIEALALERHGLRFEKSEAPVFVPTQNGPGFFVHRDAEKGAAALASVSERDADRYRTFRAFIERLRGFLADVMTSPPPALLASNKTELWDLGRRGLALRRLGKKDMLEIMRVVPMCVADWLNESFSTPALVEALAAPAVTGSFMGPWSAGTAANLLLLQSCASRSVEGGPAAVIDALKLAAEAAGVTIRTDAEVERIHVERGRAAGVSIAGEVTNASFVVATCDPKHTMLKLLHPAQLEVRVADQFRAIRARGTSAVVQLALSGPLELQARPGELIDAISIGGGHVDDLERAFDAVKYGRCSDHPHLEVRVPSVQNPDLAPAGHHVVSILASFAPYALREGWTDDKRDALGRTVLERLAKHAPTVRDRIVARQVLTPADLEARYGLTGGHLFHGEVALDQLLFMRPTPSSAGYATPIDGLFLGGSGSHPGGGVTGAPGMLAAQAVLRR